MKDVEKAQPLILDCGCGSGTYAYSLGNKSYVGLDVNSTSIELTHKFHPDNMFIVGDATKLPFRNQIFDCDVCSEVLEPSLVTQPSWLSWRELLKSLED